jgi:NAD(P)-dependent dehydrogenase (short-subunit alcohol dehydrogenase family)
MFDFSTRVVLITGSAGALGQVAAQSFAKAGAQLALLDSRADRLQEIFKDLSASGDHFLAGSTDLTQAESVRHSIEQVIDHFQRLDVVLNIAGGFRAGQPLHETPTDVWDLMFDLNARSVYNVGRAAIPQMLKQGSGKFISVAARAALHGSANQAAYTASKSVVLRLTESMAAELRESNINVNCILPGTIDTPANRSSSPDADYSHWVDPQDLINVMLFLASDAARAIHGAAIPVYGLS